MTGGVEAAGGIAAGAFALFALALMVFMATVQPIWCVVDCAVDRRRSGVGKAVWIVVLILLFGLANWFYGAFAAAGPWLRRVSRLAWLVALLLLVAFIAMYNMSENFRRGIDDEWERKREFMVLAAGGPAAAGEETR